VVQITPKNDKFGYHMARPGVSTCPIDVIFHVSCTAFDELTLTFDFLHVWEKLQIVIASSYSVHF
jgi:hypothetical protein